MAEYFEVKMSERCKKVLMEIFECGEIDIDILLSIDTEILIEAIGRLKEERAPLNFPNVFREAVETAIDKFNLRDGVSEVDGNYAAARVYASTERAYKVLSEKGFPIVF